MTDELTASAATFTPQAKLPAFGNSSSQIREAARQFEALLIDELLKLSHGADSTGWLGTDSDEAGQTGVEMAEEQLSRMIAQSGGLGLSATIESGLKRASAKADSDVAQ